MNCPICNTQIDDKTHQNETHYYHEKIGYKVLKAKDFILVIYGDEICSKNICISINGEPSKWYKIPNFKIKPSHLSLECLESSINRLIILS